MKTDLITRYEEETKNPATYIWHNKKIINNDFPNWASYIVKKLEEENADLRSQLTWRDVSDEPKENDLYICKYYDKGETAIYRDTFEWLNGRWLTDYNEVIIGWLPIPKE